MKVKRKEILTQIHIGSPNVVKDCGFCSRQNRQIILAGKDAALSRSAIVSVTKRNNDCRVRGLPKTKQKEKKNVTTVDKIMKVY